MRPTRRAFAPPAGQAATSYRANFGFNILNGWGDTNDSHLLYHQVFHRELLPRRVAPQVLPHALVQAFGEAERPDG